MRNISEDFLGAEVYSALSRHAVGNALDLLHLYVDRIINDVRATSRVLSSKQCDDLCREISSNVVDEVVDVETHINPQFSTVFLLSEIIEAGGHIELLKDYIGLELFSKPCIIVTNLFSRQNLQIVEKFCQENNVEVFVVTAVDSLSRLRETRALLKKISPQKLILLNHHQDSGAIVAALSQLDCQKYFIHHADHQLCLGVTCEEFIHIDLHNMGYWDCRTTLGVKTNKYWPLIVRQNSLIRATKPFINEEGLLTCSSGSGRKFESINYKYDYFELLPKILLATKGSHVHIGPLTREQLDGLKTNFEKSNIDWDRFHHIPWVSSISRELFSLGVDLYISSFPMGGGKTILEAMSVGIPLLMHENYRSRLLGGVDLAYPKAFIWRNENELFRVFDGISPQILEKHSEWALRHFISWHSEKVLIEAVDDLTAQDIKKIPKLKEYYPNELQAYLEETSLIDSKVEILSSEIERVNSEWSIAVKLIEEIQEENKALDQTINELGRHGKERDQTVDELGQKIKIRDQTINELGQRLQLIQGSFSWNVTPPLRWAIKMLGLVGLHKSKVTSVLIKMEKAAEFKLSDDQVGSDFDEKFYCAMYPDILKNGIDPLKHFRIHGQGEGRLGKAPPLNIRGTFKDFSTELETVIVVSHEATLTGAPILAKNIVNDLRGRYNVIAILMGGGPLTEAFYKKGVVRVLVGAARNNELIAEYMMAELLQERHIKFAIVNTIESSSILPSLAHRGIPTVSLIHEFASSVRSKEAFRKSCFWPEQVVFSSKITYDNFVDELPDLSGVPINILAQGKSYTCLSNYSALCGESRRQLSSFFQNQNEDCMVILGVGTIYYRKGVDLFIQCALHLKTLNPDKEFVFAWIGKNVDDELGVDYFTYLSDQIKRSDLQGKVFFFDEMADLEFAYKAADILLLTSRLDPLPNVAIDALFNGVPVLCFDKASGIAVILKEEGLEDICIAPFLDVKSMAEKVSKLANSEELFQNTKQQCQNLAKARFSMANYVSELERIAGVAALTKAQFLKDVSEIKDSGLFRFDYATASHWKGLSENEIIAAYIRGWRTGIDLRKPMPGFHPGIYKEKHGVTNLKGDPFADFIRKGCPVGPWSTEVITTNDGIDDEIEVDMSVALHIHAFYPEMLSKLLDRIYKNKIRPDLFISVSTEEAKKTVEKLVLGFHGSVKKIVITPNKGRDIGPLLTEFGEELINRYDVIGHIHTKNSPHVESQVGEAWSNFLLENLLGGEIGGAMADKILSKMYCDEGIGLVYPDDPHPIGWDKNLKYAEDLAIRLKIKTPLNNSFNFPVGTMFWARSEKLATLINLGLKWEDYPVEPIPIDGTMLHAMERIIPFLECKKSTKVEFLNIIGVSR